MKSKEIAEQIRQNREQQKALSAEKMILEREYIEALENEYPIKRGDRVNVVSEKGLLRMTGIFGGFTMKYSSPDPIIFKMKKDGSASANKYFMYYGEVIEKIEK